MNFYCKNKNKKFFVVSRIIYGNQPGGEAASEKPKDTLTLDQELDVIAKDKNIHPSLINNVKRLGAGYENIKKEFVAQLKDYNSAINKVKGEYGNFLKRGNQEKLLKYQTNQVTQYVDAIPDPIGSYVQQLSGTLTPLEDRYNDVPMGRKKYLELPPEGKLKYQLDTLKDATDRIFAMANVHEMIRADLPNESKPSLIPGTQLPQLTKSEVDK